MNENAVNNVSVNEEFEEERTVFNVDCWSDSSSVLDELNEVTKTLENKSTFDNTILTIVKHMSRKYNRFKNKDLDDYWDFDDYSDYLNNKTEEEPSYDHCIVFDKDDSYIKNAVLSETKDNNLCIVEDNEHVYIDAFNIVKMLFNINYFYNDLDDSQKELFNKCLNGYADYIYYYNMIKASALDTRFRTNANHDDYIIANFAKSIIELNTACNVIAVKNIQDIVENYPSLMVIPELRKTNNERIG